MARDLPPRLRAQFALTRRLTALLRILGVREQAISLRIDILQARRLAFERFGSPRYSRPALHAMDVQLDRIIDRDGGFFVEAGGFDGFTQSNTYYLERFRGWRGILVEPMPDLARLARRQRPGARIVQCALVARDFPGDSIEMEFGDLMTTVSHPDAREWTGPGLVQGWRDHRTEQVPARRLGAVLDEAGAPPIDLLSLDVEGYEAQALDGLDLDRHAPAWILVEMHDLDRGRERIAPILNGRYEEHVQLSPLDVLYRRRDVSARPSAGAAAP